MQKQLTRADVPAALTWNLDDLYESAAAWESALAEVEAAIPGVARYKGRLGENAAVLLACLDAQEQLYIKFMQVATYANLRSSEDGTNPANQGASGRVASLSGLAGGEWPNISQMISEVFADRKVYVFRYKPGMMRHPKPHKLQAV